MELPNRFFALAADAQDEILASCLDALADQRPMLFLVLLWTEYDDQSIQRVADRMHVSPSSVHKMHREACTELASLIDRQLDKRKVG